MSNANTRDAKLFLVDAKGTKVNCSVRYEADRIIIEKANLVARNYFFFIRERGVVIGKGKLIVQ